MKNILKRTLRGIAISLLSGKTTINKEYLLGQIYGCKFPNLAQSLSTNVGGAHLKCIRKQLDTTIVSFNCVTSIFLFSHV